MNKSRITAAKPFGERLAARIKAEMDVLDGQRCRICYAPLADDASTLCGGVTCKEQDNVERELQSY